MIILGIEPYIQRYEQANNDYNAILLKALADRLAETLAEWLHAKIRRELWGYAKHEKNQLIAEQYQGIHPEPGYPACPDHTEKLKIFDLLDVKKYRYFINGVDGHVTGCFSERLLF